MTSKLYEEIRKKHTQYLDECGFCGVEFPCDAIFLLNKLILLLDELEDAKMITHGYAERVKRKMQK